MKTQIQNLNNMATMIGSLNEARTTPLYFGGQNGREQAEDWVGVYNMQTGKLATVAGKHYQVIQHNDVLAAVSETLGRLNMQVTGRLDNHGDKMKCDLVFTDENGKTITDDATGIKIGIRVLNSYDKTSSFRLEMFAFRMVCQNGMSFGESMGVREITKHWGSKEKTYAEICKTTEEFITAVINSSERLQNVVNNMMGESMEYQTAELIVKKLVSGKKHREELLKRIEGCKSRWELYNAVTNYATHGQFVSPMVEAYMERVGQKIMTTPTAQLLKLVEVE